MGLTPTLAALFGGIATAVAIFAGGLAVEATKRRHDRMGMALALAGAIDALLGLIEARNMMAELLGALEALDAGRAVEVGSLIRDNAPFQAITLSCAGRLGGLRDDLPFRVARFLTYSQGLQHDLGRLDQDRDRPQVQAMLIRRTSPLWEETRTLGTGVVADLREAAGGRRRGRRRP